MSSLLYVMPKSSMTRNQRRTSCTLCTRKFLAISSVRYRRNRVMARAPICSVRFVTRGWGMAQMPRHSHRCLRRLLDLPTGYRLHNCPVAFPSQPLDPMSCRIRCFTGFGLEGVGMYPLRNCSTIDVGLRYSSALDMLSPGLYSDTTQAVGPLTTLCSA